MKNKLKQIVFIVICSASVCFSQSMLQSNGRLYPNSEKTENAIDVAILYPPNDTCEDQFTIMTDTNAISKTSMLDTMHSSYYSRFLLNNNGFGLKGGEGYYQNCLLFFNNMGYGISDRLSVGGGFFYLGSPLKLWANANYNFILAENARLNVGALVLNLNDGVSAIPMTSFTLGTKKTNVSIGYGYEIRSGGVLSMNALIALWKGTYLVTENYFTSDLKSTYNILGLRFNQKKYAFDLGMFGVPYFHYIPFLPYIGICLPFGKK